jgi:hypothetical protein
MEQDATDGREKTMRQLRSERAKKAEPLHSLVTTTMIYYERIRNRRIFVFVTAT